MLMEKRFAHYPLSFWILITLFLAAKISPDSDQGHLIQGVKVETPVLSESKDALNIINLYNLCPLL